MGRGRQKAKQTKVARQLKYSSPDTDYDALARELHGDSAKSTVARPVDGAGEDNDDGDEGPVVNGHGAHDADDDDWAEPSPRR